MKPCPIGWKRGLTPSPTMFAFLMSIPLAVISWKQSQGRAWKRIDKQRRLKHNALTRHEKGKRQKIPARPWRRLDRI
jgi:hypothetical protein